MEPTITNSNNIKRRTLTLSEKKYILELHNQGLKQKDVAKLFNVGRSTVTKVITNKKKILENTLSDIHDPRLRIRENPYYGLELRLFNWCILGDEEHISDINSHFSSINTLTQLKEEGKLRDGVNKEDILIKAEEIANKIGIEGFKPTEDWYIKFKRRFKLRFKKVDKKTLTPNNNNILNDSNMCLTSDKEASFRTFQVCSNVPENFNLIQPINYNQELSVLPSPVSIAFNPHFNLTQPTSFFDPHFSPNFNLFFPNLNIFP